MKPLRTVAALACFAFAFTPSTFGIAQNLIPAKWEPQAPVAKQPIPALKGVETALVYSLVKVLENRPEDALKGIDAIIAENPNFRLAHLIKGDLLLARAQAISTMGNTNKATSAALDDMREEAKVRLARYINSPPLDLVPQHILQMSPDEPYALVVDTARSRLYVYQNQHGEPRYITDYYISSGKNGAEKAREGDQRTPIGVYQVIANLPKSQLTDFYGAGAFPLSYPNERDRLEGRNGHGIWLHGTPSDTYSRPPRASNGCVVLANQDLVELTQYLRIGVTPVVIGTKLDWIEPQKWRAERDKILTALESWRRDWESRDINRYVSHYHKQFTTEGKDLEAWNAQKLAITASKSAIKVDISNVSIYAYPGVKSMVVVSFDQDYRSNSLESQMRKRQYWLLDGNRWQILFEGITNSPTNLIAKR